MTRRLTKRDQGKRFTFRGFDGKTYAAEIGVVHRGIATIEYDVQMPDGRRGAVAHLERRHWDRLTLAD